MTPQTPHPPFGHPLPQGEREAAARSPANTGTPVLLDKPGATSLPSPLEGEGGASAPGEGSVSALTIERRQDKLLPLLRSRARSMRHVPTEAERLMWALLRGRRFVNYKFRRQVPMGRYIVDFFCPSAGLIVELDGSQHAENAHDQVRDAWLKSENFRILRFWNSDLNSDRDSVMDSIWAHLEGMA